MLLGGGGGGGERLPLQAGDNAMTTGWGCNHGYMRADALVFRLADSIWDIGLRRIKFPQNSAWCITTLSF